MSDSVMFVPITRVLSLPSVLSIFVSSNRFSRTVRGVLITRGMKPRRSASLSTGLAGKDAGRPMVQRNLCTASFMEDDRKIERRNDRVRERRLAKSTIATLLTNGLILFAATWFGETAFGADPPWSARGHSFSRVIPKARMETRGEKVVVGLKRLDVDTINSRPLPVTETAPGPFAPPLDSMSEEHHDRERRLRRESLSNLRKQASLAGFRFPRLLGEASFQQE